MNRNTGQRYSNSSIIKYKKRAFSAEMQIVSLLCCYSFLIQLFLCTTGMRQLPKPAELVVIRVRPLSQEGDPAPLTQNSHLTQCGAISSGAIF